MRREWREALARLSGRGPARGCDRSPEASRVPGRVGCPVCIGALHVVTGGVRSDAIGGVVGDIRGGDTDGADAATLPAAPLPGCRAGET